MRGITNVSTASTGNWRLNLRIKPKRRIKRDFPGELNVPTAPNQVWSMDFMSHQLVRRKSLPTFNMLDDYNRKGLGIEANLTPPASRMIGILDKIIEWRGRPAALRCANGILSIQTACYGLHRPAAQVIPAPGK